MTATDNDLCIIAGCGRKYASRGYCKKHYLRWFHGKDVLMIRDLFESTPESMFWQHANITANPNKCWLWKYSLNTGGYGQIEWNGKQRNAHSVAFEIVNGLIPAGMEIRHVICRTPACINPAHLTMGTHQENIDDKKRDGTMSRGENHPKAKITDQEKEYILTMLRRGAKGADLARQFNMSRSAISYHKRRDDLTKAVLQQGTIQ